MDLWNLFKSFVSEFHYIWIFKDIVFCSERPTELHYNTNNQLHSEKTAAVKYVDGYSLYALNGVRCEPWVVETPAEKIDCQKILKEENVEIRRELVRKVGVERVVQKLGATVLNKQGDYELLQIDLKLSKPGIALKMKNPSIDTWHIEFVPSKIKTVQQAINWRAQEVLITGDWQPEQLT